MGKSKKALIQKLASEHNLPLKTVSDIVESQFKYVTSTIEKGKFDSVRLPYFGNFSVKKGRVQYLDKLKKKKNGSVNNK